MAADYEVRNAAGVVLRTSPDRGLAESMARELAEQFDHVSVQRVIRYECREIISEFLSERERERKQASGRAA